MGATGCSGLPLVSSSRPRFCRDHRPDAPMRPWHPPAARPKFSAPRTKTPYEVRSAEDDARRVGRVCGVRSARSSPTTARMAKSVAAIASSLPRILCSLADSAGKRKHLRFWLSVANPSPLIAQVTPLSRMTYPRPRAASSARRTRYQELRTKFASAAPCRSIPTPIAREGVRRRRIQARQVRLNLSRCMTRKWSGGEG